MHLQTVNLIHVDYSEFGCAFTAGSSGGTAGRVIRFWWTYFLMYSWTMPAQIKGTMWCLMIFICQTQSLMNPSVEQELHFCGAIPVQLLGSFFSAAWSSVLIILTVWFNGRKTGWALGFCAHLVKAQNQNQLNPERIPCMQKASGKKGKITPKEAWHVIKRLMCSLWLGWSHWSGVNFLLSSANLAHWLFTRWRLL